MIDGDPPTRRRGILRFMKASMAVSASVGLLASLLGATAIAVVLAAVTLGWAVLIALVSRTTSGSA